MGWWFVLVVGVSGRQECRECESFDNIVVVDGLAQAGLGDRATFLSAAGNLATSLCARLNVPDPENLLSSRHANKSGHRGVEWSRYVETRRIADNESYLTKESGCELFSLALRSRKPDEMVGHLEIAVDAVDRGVDVCWRITGEFWSWPRSEMLEVDSIRLPPRLFFKYPSPVVPRPQCEYVLVSTSRLAKAIARAVLGTLGLDGPEAVAVLHVRRNDRVGRGPGLCDSSVEAVLEHLDCSGARTISESHMLVFSDERDPGYRYALLEGIRRRFVVNVDNNLAVHDGDALLFATQRNVDNYLIYAAIAYIVGAAASSFLIRPPCSAQSRAAPCRQHRMCHPCDSQPFTCDSMKLDNCLT